MTPVRIALGVGLAGLGLAVILMLGDSEQRLAGANRAAAPSFVAKAPAHGELCQDRELVPRDTEELGLVVGAYGKAAGPVDVTIEHAGEPIVNTRLEKGFNEGAIQIPVERIDATVGDATVCLANRGPFRFVVGGSRVSKDFAAVADGRPQKGRFRVEYLRGGSESRLDMLATAADRLPRGGPAFFGSWTLPFAAFLIALAVGIAVATLARSERRDG